MKGLYYKNFKYQPVLTVLEVSELGLVITLFTQ